MSDSNTRAYLFKFRGSDYVFCRTAGHGAEAQAQVVRKVSTGELLIRKVSRNRLDRSKCIEPNEFHLVEEYLSKPPRSPDIRPLIPKFYGYEKIQSKNGLFHLVSYWQLINGGSVKDLIMTKYNSIKHTKFNPDKRFPARLIARMLHQLSDIPDFYLGDFGYAGWDFGFNPNHMATRDIDQVMEWARLLICINLPEHQRPPRDGAIPYPDDPQRGSTIPGDAPMTATLSLYYDSCHELKQFKDQKGLHIRAPSCPPPDLSNFIRRAEGLEKKLTPSLTGCRWEAIDDIPYHRPGKTRGSGRGLRAISESPDEEDGETDSEPDF
ncbi:hypothetical protein QR685DRAFT_567711 [Neurospora intermedia]|uniref:Protein kinase domain-containing protein n=1 Tax=Neurospora intermedia TaxID=5142 RepID=A0ABR3DQ78_NEUIN